MQLQSNKRHLRWDIAAMLMRIGQFVAIHLPPLPPQHLPGVSHNFFFRAPPKMQRTYSATPYAAQANANISLYNQSSRYSDRLVLTAAVTTSLPYQ